MKQRHKSQVGVKCFMVEKIGKGVSTYEEDGSGCVHFNTLPNGFDSTKWQGRYVCNKCKRIFRATVLGSVWSTESGKLQPGAMYWDDDIDGSLYWDNQPGPSLCVVLPDMHIWNIDSRASNCDMKNDRLHRCWVREGVAPNITVSKRGVSCKAGAGSILTHDHKGKASFHGFLRNGYLKP